MKKLHFIFTATLFLLFAGASGQKPIIELTFTADFYGQNILLDSILIKNLTQGGDTILYAPDTSLILGDTVGVIELPAFHHRNMVVAQNHPNPFKEETTFTIYLSQKEHIQISAFNLLGQKTAFYENIFDNGYHRFTFYSGKKNYYLLVVQGENKTGSIKMAGLNSKYNGLCKIVYTGSDYKPKIIKSSRNNNFNFNIGDELKFIGYTSYGQAEIIDTLQGNKSYEFLILALNIPCPGIPNFIYGEQMYNTVQIGTQCWMAENLNIGTMVTRSSTNNKIIEKYCYNNSFSNCYIYGGLYQWDEMMQYSTQQGAQGICPEGWHIPSDSEWTELIDFLGGESVAGGKMKSLLSFWNNPNTGATNESGFSALPAGCNGEAPLFSFENLGKNGIFWTSSPSNIDGAFNRGLTSTGAYISRYYHKTNKTFSVRCVKDGAEKVRQKTQH